MKNFFAIFLLALSVFLISSEAVNYEKDSSIEVNRKIDYSEDPFFESSLKKYSVSAINSTINPPSIENSIIFVSREEGKLKGEFFQNDTVSISDNQENNLFSIIETNLSSLQYDKKATGDNESTNDYWIRSSEGLFGPNRLEGTVDLDYANVFEGKASTKFSVMTNTSLNWYSDYQLPGWIDEEIPSIFNHSSYINGAYQFNASQNLQDHEFGFNNWLRLIFDNNNYAINLIFNRSSGLIENNSSFYLKSNEDFIVNIVLNSADGNQNVLTWKDGEWIRFRINLTGILNAIYPVNSPLRLEAEQAFSNLSLTLFDLQSYAFEIGKLDFRLDDFHWITTFLEEEKTAWERNHHIFTDIQGNPLTNMSEYDLISSSQWKVLTTSKNLILKSPASFSPFIPIWEYKKQTFYYYSQSWYNKINSMKNFQLGISFKLDSDGLFIASDNSPYQIISQPVSFLKILRYSTLFDLLSIEISVSFFRFNPYNENNTQEILKESRYWKKIIQNEGIKLENTEISLINDLILSNVETTFGSSISYELDKQEIFVDNELQDDFNSIFVENLLDDLPHIKESITMPNLLLEDQIPIITIFGSGLQLELLISSDSTTNSYKLFSELVTSDLNSVLSHSFVLNEKSVIFIPWTKIFNDTEQIIIKLFLTIENNGIGWFEEVLLINKTYDPSHIPLTTETFFSSSENSQGTNTSNNFTISNNDNSMINRPNSFLYTESSNIALYGLMIIGPILGSIFYFKRRQRSKLYNLLYDE